MAARSQSASESAVAMPFGRVRGDGQRLGRDDGVAAVSHQIGEGTADVDANDAHQFTTVTRAGFRARACNRLYGDLSSGTSSRPSRILRQRASPWWRLKCASSIARARAPISARVAGAFDHCCKVLTSAGVAGQDDGPAAMLPQQSRQFAVGIADKNHRLAGRGNAIKLTGNSRPSSFGSSESQCASGRLQRIRQYEPLPDRA